MHSFQRALHAQFMNYICQFCGVYVFRFKKPFVSVRNGHISAGQLSICHVECLSLVWMKFKWCHHHSMCLLTWCAICMISFLCRYLLPIHVFFKYSKSCVQIDQQTLLPALDGTYASDKLTADYIFFFCVFVWIQFIFNILIVDFEDRYSIAINVMIHLQMREWTVKFQHNWRKKKTKIKMR